MPGYDVPAAIRDTALQAREYLDELQREADAAAEALQAFVLDNEVFAEFEQEEPFSPSQAQEVTAEDIGALRRASLKLDLSLFDPDRFKRHTYVSEFFDFLEPKLTEFIQTGGTGIDEDVQNALFDRMYEKDIRNLRDALVEAESNVSRRGFPMPVSMSQAARDDIIERWQNDKHERGREVTALIAERAQDNVKHAIDSGIRMEDVQSNFTKFFHQTYLEYARVITEAYRTEQNTYIEEFKGNLDRARINLEAENINAQTDSRYRQQLQTKWETSARHAIEKTKALIAQGRDSTELQLKAANALTEYYRSLIAGIAGQINTITVASDQTTSSPT